MLGEDIVIQDPLIESYQEQEQQKEKRLDRKVFRCLTCNFIPILTLDNENKNVIIKCINGHNAQMSLSEYMQKGFLNSLDRVICNKCNIKHEPKKVFKYCENCDKIFCKSCLKEHNKIYLNHYYISVRKMDIICCKHELNFSFFCEQCQKNLCIKCIHTHKKKGHQLLSLKKSKLSKNKLNEIMDFINKEVESLNEIINFFNEKIELIKDKFYEAIKLQKQILKFKSNIVYTYELKDTNYQILTNIKNLELVSEKFEPPDEFLDELESLKYLFKFLKIIDDNPENNTFNYIQKNEKIENEEQSEKSEKNSENEEQSEEISENEKKSERNSEKEEKPEKFEKIYKHEEKNIVKNEIKKKPKNTWNKGKKIYKNITPLDLSDKNGFVEINNNNLKETSGNSTNPKRKNKQKNQIINNNFEIGQNNINKKGKYQEIIDIDSEEVEINQENEINNDFYKNKKNENQTKQKTKIKLFYNTNIDPDSLNICRSSDELSTEDLYGLIQSPISSKKILNNSQEELKKDIPQFQRKEMKIDFSNFFKNVKTNINKNIINNIKPMGGYFIPNKENSRYEDEEDDLIQEKKIINYPDTKKIIYTNKNHTNIKPPKAINKKNRSRNKNNNNIINNDENPSIAKIKKSFHRDKKRKKKLLDGNKIFISTTLSRSFEDTNENNPIDSSLEENKNLITINRSFNDEENQNFMRKSHPLTIIQKFRDKGCFGSKEKIYSLKFENGISCICEINAVIFAIGNLIGDIEIYNLENFKLFQKIFEHIGTINSIFKLHDNSILSASADKKMKKITLKNGFKKYNVDFVFVGYNNYVMKGIELSLNKSIISCSCDENIFIWDYEKNNNYSKRKIIKVKKRVEDILEVLNNEFVSISDNELKFWKSENFSNICTISGVRSFDLPNSLSIINEKILAVIYIHELELIDLIEHNYMGSIAITEGNLTTIISLNDGSFLLGEENLTDTQNIFWIKQYVLENDEFYYLSFKKNKFLKTNKENDRELRALMQFSNGIIVEGISGEINGKDYGDVFFYS